MATYCVVTDSVVNIKITGSASDFVSEKRYPKNLQIWELKSKLELITGCTASNMKLELFDNKDKFICFMDNNDALFGSYPVEDGYRINCNDPTSKGAFEFSGDGKPLFNMTDEEYGKRTDTVKEFKRINKLGEFAKKDPEEERLKREKEAADLERDENLIAGMKVGDRCECTTSNKSQLPRRGEVMYLGSVDALKGLWVGVKLDEPTGKNDGTVAGKQYFTCDKNYGSFFKPANVTVGDFPELDIDDMDEI